MGYNTKFGGTHETPRRSVISQRRRGSGKAVNNERKTFLQEKSERIKALKEKENRTPEETQEIVGDIFAMRQAAAIEVAHTLGILVPTLENTDQMKAIKKHLNPNELQNMKQDISEIRLKAYESEEITADDLSKLVAIKDRYAELDGIYLGQEPELIKNGSKFGLNEETMELLGKDEEELTKALSLEKEQEQVKVEEIEKSTVQKLSEKEIPAIVKSGTSAEKDRQVHLKEMGDTLANLDVENLSREDAQAAMKLSNDFTQHAAVELSSKLGTILMDIPSGEEKQKMSKGITEIKNKIRSGEEVTKDDLATLNGIRLAVGNQLTDGNSENKYAQAIISGAKFNMTNEAIDFALDDEKHQALSNVVEQQISVESNQAVEQEYLQDHDVKFAMSGEEYAQVQRMMGVDEDEIDHRPRMTVSGAGKTIEETMAEPTVDIEQKTPVNEHVEAFKQMDPQEFTQPELSAQDAYVANLVKESVEQTVEEPVVEEPNTQLDEKVLAAEELLNNMHQESLKQKAQEPDLNINTSAQFEYTEQTNSETLAQNGYEDPSSVAYEMPEAEVEEDISMEEIHVTNEDRLAPKEKEKPSLMERMRAGLASTKEAFKEKVKPYVLAASMRKETAKVKDENIAFEPQKTAMTGYDEDDLEVSTADLEVAAQEFRGISEKTLNEEPANDISHGIVLEEEGREEEVGLVMNR